MGRKQDGTVLIGVGAANGRHVVGVAGDGEQVGEALGGRVGVAVRIGDDKVDEVERKSKGNSRVGSSSSSVTSVVGMQDMSMTYEPMV